MNEARVYADGFERSFAEVKDLLEFLAERGRNAKWIRKPTNTLRLAPLEKEAQNLDAADASMEEILRWKADGRAESMELSIRWKISWRLYHGQRRVS